MVTLESTLTTKQETRLTDRLAVIDLLLHTFHHHNINYCHWKSNEHLQASMEGDTDLDILFDYSEKQEIEELLASIGFKQFVSIKEKQYQDISDYLCLDPTSGKVVHLHAHFKLTLGESYLKSFQPDIAHIILANKIFDNDHQIYCSSPSFELILLYIRESLKLRNRDILKNIFSKEKAYSPNILKEYYWLKHRVNEEDLYESLKKITLRHEAIFNLIRKPLSKSVLLKLRPLIVSEFNDTRIYTGLNAHILRWYREVSVKALRVFSRILPYPVLAKRVHPNKGLTVAVIGADGSGKSTVTTDIVKTFQIKLDVFRVYLGRGDGKASLTRKALLMLKSFVSKPNPKKVSNNDGEREIRKRSFSENLFRCVYAIVVAREKLQNLKRVEQAKEKGMLVVCDRYPQNKQPGFNDGPLLYNLCESSNFLLRSIAVYEASLYAKMTSFSPDVLIKLIAEADIVSARKPGETAIDLLRKKIEGIKQLHFENTTNVKVVDASQSLEQVLRTVKTTIWESY